MYKDTELRRIVKTNRRAPRGDGVVSSSDMESNKYFLPISVLAAGVLVAGAVMWRDSNPSPAAPAAGGEPAAPIVDIKNVKVDGNPFIGQANAQITIAYWSDFQCPFCKKFDLETMPQVLKDYVDTGKAKVVFMDYAFLGDDSITAGEYSRAVWKLYPDKYLVWREAMYEAQDEEGDQGFGDAVSIDALNASIAGLDAVKISADVKANASTYRTMMDSNYANAKENGVTATPSFVIGTKLIQGAYPYATFKSALDALVK